MPDGAPWKKGRLAKQQAEPAVTPVREADPKIVPGLLDDLPMLWVARASRISVCWVVMTLALVVGGIVAAATFLENFTWCASRVVREFPSQAKGYAATVGMTGCGATGPDTSFVMTRSPGKKLILRGTTISSRLEATTTSRLFGARTAPI